jgi:catechol 2,3-dioxygenase-like lactoylglutathione lyase family enzyme
MSTADSLRLDGIHHVKLPVRDLAVSSDWYASRLGYRRQIEFVEGGRLMGVSMVHDAGGPMVGLRLDPERAAVVAGFDYFSIGVPDKDAMDRLAAHLDGLGEHHAGVHFATIGWILPMLHDPDGHELRFYTTDHHTEYGEEVVVVEDPRERAEARERALLQDSTS